MSIDREAVAARLRQIMKSAGMTQQELAAYLRISQPAVSFYLKGRLPPADVLLTAARIGNTTVDWILTGKVTPEPELRLREERSLYGSEAALLEVWEELPETLRKDLLALMMHLKEFNT